MQCVLRFYKQNKKKLDNGNTVSGLYISIHARCICHKIVQVSQYWLNWQSINQIISSLIMSRAFKAKIYIFIHRKVLCNPNITLSILVIILSLVLLYNFDRIKWMLYKLNEMRTWKFFCTKNLPGVIYTGGGKRKPTVEFSSWSKFFCCSTKYTNNCSLICIPGNPAHHPYLLDHKIFFKLKWVFVSTECGPCCLYKFGGRPVKSTVRILNKIMHLRDKT
jgi:hypothetical protein